MNRNILTYLIVFLLLPFVAGAQFISKDKREKKEVVVVSGLNSEQELCRVIGSKFAVPTVNYEPVTPPKFWKKGILTEVGFSQVSLTNWAAGGSGSVALNTYVNAHINYAKGNMYWENRGQFTYGFVQSFQDGYRKSSDKIVLDSKFGYRAVDKFYFSAVFNFTSQFSPGFNYASDGTATMVSKMFAPAYMSLGLGIDYKPGKGEVFSLNFAPLTGSTVIVTDSLLRARYSNAPDEAVRFELGAQLTANLKYEIFKNCKLTTTLNLFSDYLNEPQNIQIKWDFRADLKINKFLSSSLRTNLIYDDKILIADKNGHSAPRVQFQEIFSLSFTYTFGEFVK
ncbi:MAG: DUF3078 domain-containing protein [Bacteroidales bacterium]|nr:DUF3078 domain-containing protein [Bacteroidales bacterium]